MYKKILLAATAYMSMFYLQAQDFYGSSSKNKISTVIDIIDQYYVDEENDTALVETAIRAMLEELDPHSVYIPAKNVKSMNEPLEGNFDGIGVQFNILDDTIIVISPISGGPSEKLGIMAGDKIIKIKDSVVAGVGFTNEDVVRELRGKKGSEVNISIMRRNEAELIEYNIVRDEIPIYSVDATYMATPTIGYIKVNRFAATTSEELATSLKTLKEQGMQHLILDLQGNSGGYLNTAINMADQFLKDNQMIVYTEGRSSPRYEAKATSRGAFEEGKLAVLIDEGSASASEIVSGAIQDHDRGIIIGRRSFGKGLVQKPYNLPDGSSMRLTISRYYTPTGRCIQKPYDKGVEAYRKDLKNRYDEGQLVSEDSINFPDSLIYYTPHNRPVYGGGGIMPDFFIPIDTTQRSDFYINTRKKGIINSFSVSYADKNRKELAKYNSVNEFKAKFGKDEEYLEDFIKYASKNKIDTEGITPDNVEEILKIQLKAFIGRNIFNTGAYYEIINDINDSYLKAIEVISDNTFEDLEIAYK